jgi:hypothetical protein
MEAATKSSVNQVPGTPYFGGPWFMSPFLEREIAERGLDPETADLVRFFSENGYLVVEDLGVDDFDALADRANADLAPLHEGGAYNRIQDAWATSDAVREIATLPKVVGLLETLYGRRPIPFQTLNFLKGSQQETHPDSYHFHSWPKHYMCGVWVALEDLTESNGPLHYYPGSHRLPDYDFLSPGQGDRLVQFVRDVVEAYDLQREQAQVKKGQALIWSANLLHGGDPVLDPESTRLSQVTHYFFEDCSYTTPLRSDFERGQVYFRQIVDVGTGRTLPLRSPHGRLPVSLRSRLINLRVRAGRRFRRGYVRHVV